jgi:hypothetical protein
MDKFQPGVDGPATATRPPTLVSSSTCTDKLEEVSKARMELDNKLESYTTSAIKRSQVPGWNWTSVSYPYISLPVGLSGTHFVSLSAANIQKQITASIQDDHNANNPSVTGCLAYSP